MREMRRKDRLVSDVNEIKDIIRQGKTCWVAIVDNGIPHMISLNYDSNFLGGGTLELYLHCNLSNENLDIFKKSNDVCFEISHDEGMHIDIDTPGKSTLYYSSVIGNGEMVFSETQIEKMATVPLPVINQLDVNIAKAIISQNKTCHIAMSDSGTPYIVPLSYGSNFVNNNTLELYFHSAIEGRKIDALKKTNKVCFEIESAEENFVAGNGEVLFLEGEEKLTALSAMFKQQSGKDIVVNDAMARGICVYKMVSTDFLVRSKQLQIGAELNDENCVCKIVSMNYAAKRNRQLV